VITSGGSAPNVVPDYAEVFYYLRHPQAETVKELWTRLEAAALGAAQGTGTSVEWEIIHGNHPLLINESLARMMDDKLREVGGFDYEASEQAFAEGIYATLQHPDLPLGSQRDVQPFEMSLDYGSTDVGDVSMVVPMRAANLTQSFQSDLPFRERKFRVLQDGGQFRRRFTGFWTKKCQRLRGPNRRRVLISSRFLENLNQHGYRIRRVLSHPAQSVSHLPASEPRHGLVFQDSDQSRHRGFVIGSKILDRLPPLFQCPAFVELDGTRLRCGLPRFVKRKSPYREKERREQASSMNEEPRQEYGLC
jgi:hypothetical protein